MDLAALRAFLITAEEGRVTRAAERLHLTQPAVSSQLARLEADLGHALFHRTPKGMVLTESGSLFRTYARAAIKRLEDGRHALDELAGLERGSLSIGGGATATTYLLPPLLGAFHAHFPNIRLFVREQGSQAVVEALLAGDLDLGIVTIPEDIGVDERHLYPEQILTDIWKEDELRLIVPPGHRLEGRTEFRWSELQGEPLVLFEAGTAVRRLIDERLAAAGVEVEIVMELRSIDSIMQMVTQGIGAAFVSRFALPGADVGLGSSDVPVTRYLALAWRRDRPLTPATEAFQRLLRYGPDGLAALATPTGW